MPWGGGFSLASMSDSGAESAGASAREGGTPSQHERSGSSLPPHGVQLPPNPIWCLSGGTIGLVAGPTGDQGGHQALPGDSVWAQVAIRRSARRQGCQGTPTAPSHDSRNPQHPQYSWQLRHPRWLPRLTAMDRVLMMKTVTALKSVTPPKETSMLDISY